MKTTAAYPDQEAKYTSGNPELERCPDTPQYVLTRIDEVEGRQDEIEGKRDGYPECDANQETVVLIGLDRWSANGDESDSPQEPGTADWNRDTPLTHYPYEAEYSECPKEKPDCYAQVPSRTSAIPSEKQGLINSHGSNFDVGTVRSS